MAESTERAPQQGLIRRVEEASMNAWPARHQMLLDGWLIRLSNGFTKRANCIVPLYYSSDYAASTNATPNKAPADAPLDKIRYCENLYARERLRTVFRLTSHPHSQPLDKLLDERRYTLLEPTRVQILDLEGTLNRQQDTEFKLVSADEWLRVYGRLSAMPTTASEPHAALIRSIRPDCAFAVRLNAGTPVACALGVVEHGLLGLFDVVTAFEHRSQGHARGLLQQLLAWGAARGAERAYLQVIATNAPALQLYARLGFNTLYSYWYRQTT